MLLEECKWIDTYPGDISGPELNRAKQAQDDDDDVEEVGQDGRPLVTQEINHLTLQHTDLRGGGGGGDEWQGTTTSNSSLYSR